MADPKQIENIIVKDGRKYREVPKKSAVPFRSAAAVWIIAAGAYYKASQLTAEGAESLKNLLIAYYYEMQSDEMRLANNEDYAKRANAYNRAIDTFPASVLCPGHTPAVLFG